MYDNCLTSLTSRGADFTKWRALRMGLWKWLAGKRERVTASDKIWLTHAAKRRGICRELGELDTRPVILLCHFPAALSGIAQELSAQNIPHRVISGQISAKVVNRLADQTTGEMQLGLVSQLESDPYTEHAAEDDGLIHILVAERHFLGEHDDAISQFAATLKKRCQVTFHLSLEDPLLKDFAGERLKELLERLGMNESTAIESSMVAARIRMAQKKRADGMQHDPKATSAEEWLQQQQ
jgi:preprotein translocase subunit SecA